MAKTNASAPRKSKEDTRKNLLKSGASSFAKSGVGGARIVTIARDAGIAVGTFYLYFKNKNELFEAVQKDGTERIIHYLTSNADREDDDALHTDRERNVLAMGRLVDFAKAYSDLFRLLLSRGGADNPLQRSLIDAIALVRTEQLQKGIESGRFFTHLRPEITARGEIGFAYHILDWWLDNPDAASREDIIASLVDVRMFGVETRRPETAQSKDKAED
jgi:AcrR family transcriptional regulator